MAALGRTLRWPGSGRPAVAPGPSLVLLRSALRGSDGFLELLDQTAEDFGDLASFSIGSTRIWCAFHPDDVERVLLGKHRDVVKDVSTRSLEVILGRGLITNDGEPWRAQRKLIAPVFTPAHIRGYAEQMVSATREMRDAEAPFGPPSSTAGRVLDVHHAMSELALEILTRTIFGAQRRPPYDAIGGLLDDILGAYARRLASWESLVPVTWPVATGRTLQRCRRKLDEIVDPMIQGTEVGDGGALLDRLLAARDDDGVAMDASQVRDEVATLLLAGHETTALSLSYAAYFLAVHPEEQAALQREIDDVLGDREPTVADLPRLLRCDAVIRESMRLLPPAWSVAREVVEPFDLRGYRISKGDQIMFAQWVTHRDARWFEEPRVFRPGRWLEPAPGRPKFAYFPFGGGPRVCVGNHFAMMSAVLGLATLAQGLHFHTTQHTKLDLVPAVTLRPRAGIELWVHRRTAGQLPGATRRH